MDKTLDIPSSVKRDRKDPRSDELEWLYSTLKTIKAKKILSIGAGVTSFVLNEALSPECFVAIEVDEAKVQTTKQHVSGVQILNNWDYDDYGPFDLVFIDSSAGYGKPGLHRDRAILSAEPSMSDDCIIIIHDFAARIGGGAKNYLEKNEYQLISYSKTGRGFGLYRRPTEADEDDSGFTDDYSSLTIITACDANHLERLQISLPTWIELKGLTCPIIVFADGIDPDSTPISSYPNVEIIPWNINTAETQREKMLSSFIFGVAEHVKTEFWLKLDSDTIAKNDDKFLKESFFNQDMVGQPWGYSKPGAMIPCVDHWLDGLQKIGAIDGFKGTEKGYLLIGDESRPDKMKYKSRRVISYARLTKTELIKEIRELIVWDRMPIPSEDTLVWRYCERMDKKWSRFKFSDHGWTHTKRNMKSIADEAMASRVVTKSQT